MDDEGAAPVNSLQELIRRRMRELRIDSYSELARRAKLPRATVHALATTETRSSLPRRETLQALAPALGIAFEDLHDAAYEAIGARRVDETIEIDGEEVRVVGADFEELTTEEQEAVNEWVREIVDAKKTNRERSR